MIAHAAKAGWAGDEVVLRVAKTAVGPMTAQEAAGIHRYGDLRIFEDALRTVLEA